MIRNGLPILLLLTLSLGLVGCEEDSAPVTGQLDGPWGARHVQLVADAEGARLVFDCAYGTIEGPLVPDADGTFVRGGTFTTVGGAERLDDPRTPEPARYQGHLVGDTLELTILLTTSGQVLGPFVLIEGETGVVYMCQ